MPGDRDPPPFIGPRPRDDAETLRLIGRDTRSTEQTARATHDVVGELRREVRSDIKRIDSQVSKLSDHVGELRETTAGVVGKLEVLVDELQTDRRERSSVRVAGAVAHIEVETTAEIARIDERKASNQHRRDLVLKAVAVLGPAAAAILTYALSHC
jgi:uncharacterized coiled-coil DUF342 family protein